MTTYTETDRDVVFSHEGVDKLDIVPRERTDMVDVKWR